MGTLFITWWGHFSSGENKVDEKCPHYVEQSCTTLSVELRSGIYPVEDIPYLPEEFKYV